MLYGRGKHNDVKYHFLRDFCKCGMIELKYCQSKDQIADIFTKALKVESFRKLRRSLVCTVKDLN